MAYERREIVGGAVPATVTSGLGDLVAGTFTIDVTTGWPTGTDGRAFYVVVDRGLATEEKMKCSARAGTTITVATRGADGSTASVHTPGASKAEIIATAVDLDEANYAVSQTIGKVTTKGDIVAATGASAFARVGTGGAGNDNQVLLANSAATAGVSFGSVVPQSISGLSGIGKGELVGASAANTFAKVSSGTNDYVLTADSAQGAGVKWSQVGALSISDSAVTPAKISGVSAIAKGGIVAGSATAGTFEVRTVGTDGQILKADSAQASGLAWMDHTVTQSQVTFDAITGGSSSASPSTLPAWLIWDGPANTGIDDGTLEGYTMTIGNLVWVHIRLEIGADTDKGDDNTPWRFGLPLDAVAGRQQIIPGYAANPDMSVIKPVTGLIRPGIATKRVGWIATPTGEAVHRQHPWTWNEDAILVLEGWYQKAA